MDKKPDEDLKLRVDYHARITPLSNWQAKDLNPKIRVVRNFFSLVPTTKLWGCKWKTKHAAGLLRITMLVKTTELYFRILKLHV